MDPLKFLESISHYRSFHRTEKFIDDFIHGHLQLITPYCAWMRTKASDFGQVYFLFHVKEIFLNTIEQHDEMAGLGRAVPWVDRVDSDTPDMEPVPCLVTVNPQQQ